MQKLDNSKYKYWCTVYALVLFDGLQVNLVLT